jgi:hypothetical protein
MAEFWGNFIAYETNVQKSGWNDEGLMLSWLVASNFLHFSHFLCQLLVASFSKGSSFFPLVSL